MLRVATLVSLAALARAEGLITQYGGHVECSDNEKAAIGDTISIEHTGFRGVVQIDSNNEG